MADPLSPELLAQLQKLGYSDPYLMSGGQMYQPMFSANQGADAAAPELLGYLGFDPNNMEIDDPNQHYKADGSFSHDSKFQKIDDTWMKLAIAAITGGAAMGAFGGTLGVSSAPGAAAAGGGGGGLGAGAMTVPTAAEAAAQAAILEGQLAPYLASSAGGAFGGGLGEMTVPTAAQSATEAAALQSSLAPYAAAGGPLSGLGSKLTSALGGSGGGSSLLGLGATALGGLAGAEGQEDSATSTKTMDPRLDKYVYGDLLPRAQGLLAQQMPIADQAGAQMRGVGMGLLNMPVAPNGFDRFTKGRYPA